jgi:hypothetical protein
VEDPFDRDYYQETNLVRDGNVITAMENTFVDFGIEICDYFKLFTHDQEERQLANHYKGIQ